MRHVAASLLLAMAGTAAFAQGGVEKLDIVTASGSHKFNVEVMRTEAEKEHGLMERRSMPADHGMLFDFQTSQPVMMWMKNTYIPLDMVFIGADGRVVSVTENATPMSEKISSSNGDVLGVVELNAGIAAKIGVKRGDLVKNAMFPQ
jgi:hypothetical protein